MNIRRAWELGQTRLEGSDFLWDRALRFGMSVFETVAIQHGRPLFLNEHLMRLAGASQQLLSVDASLFCEAAKTLDLPAGESGVLRIYVTAGPGSLIEDCAHPHGFALFESSEVSSGPGHGLSLSIDRAPILPGPGGWKTGNYWPNLRALRSARRNGFDEAVMMNPVGEVVGCATGNLFCVIDGRLLTPSLASGARSGVIREWVIEHTGAEQTLVSMDELAHAEELFVTNSRLGIASIASLDGRTLPVTTHAGSLAAQYHEKILLS